MLEAAGGGRRTAQEADGLRQHKPVVVSEYERLELGAAHEERGCKKWVQHRRLAHCTCGRVVAARAAAKQVEVLQLLQPTDGVRQLQSLLAWPAARLEERKKERKSGRSER